MKKIVCLFLMTVFAVGCGIHISNTIDLVGPQFTFSIRNYTNNNETITKENEVLECCVGDMLYVSIESIEYDNEAENTITLSIFEHELAFTNQEKVNMPIEVPDIELGKYPATVLYHRDYVSTDTNQRYGIEDNEKTLYVVVK
ncbi:MAG: hypothetical protein ACI3ZP_06650 [Candidatus Cryptobacteroides sp.]